jgi:hypothetical protein
MPALVVPMVVTAGILPGIFSIFAVDLTELDRL